ncbi:hypothetical protein VM1G_01448 [Cytospora mali]|uniref:NTF2-like protein n=1 Tax=Cytospora mali TaxID=578113 RepID=A0A194VPS4_CYTMA|nr:hypothetical protein VM1G_01448 [Valsa mali]
MSLQAVYKQFLASPNSTALAQNASLHYITTTTSFNGPTEIIKHLNAQRNQLKKNKEDFLNVIEGQDALAVQTDLSLEFQVDGGAYLPGLDDQFLSDRIVHLSIFHIVKFDRNDKITTIQQSWDQGALLKQLDVIGKTGRNWPIRDSEEQIKLIARTSGKPAEPTNATRAHANSRNEESARPVSPYAGSRPRQRTFEEILGDEPDFESPERQQSPSSRGVAPKIGAGKNFQPSRLFDKPEDAPSEPDSPDDGRWPERYVKPHPKKYNHFDFVDGSDPADAPKTGVAFDAIKSKHRQTWDFEDFVTPQKPKGKTMRKQEMRHWGTDENDIDESPAKAAPGKAGAPGKARRDADAHFEMLDDGNPSTEPRGPVRPRGAGHTGPMSLYNNHMVTEDGSEPYQSPALGNITNMQHRTKNYGPHFTMADDSPKYDERPSAPIAGDRKKAVNNMQANWSTYDESPVAQKENKPSREAPQDLRENGPNHRIKLGGDGMGNPKGGRGWSLGDESEEETAPAAVPGRKGAAQKASNSFWDY